MTSAKESVGPFHDTPAVPLPLLLQHGAVSSYFPDMSFAGT